MKKIFFLLITIMFSTLNVYAIESDTKEINKQSVKLIECVSSTTFWTNANGEVKRIRLLAYDSLDGNLNQEIEDFVCKTLESAKTLEIEYDAYSSKDKYNREMVWVYVDGKLLQNILLSKGYGQVNYVTSDYKYLDSLCETQKKAITNKLGIWNYEGVKESYCKSGIEIGKSNNKKNEDKNKVKKYDQKKLNYLVLLNSGILLLLITYIIMKRDK